MIIKNVTFTEEETPPKKPVREIFLNLCFNIKIDPGEYQIEIIVHDQFSDKSTSFKLPFQKQ